jgi:hypothetical protein
MAEPTVGKVSALALLAATLGPVWGEYAFILAGAFIGGYAGLSLYPERKDGFTKPLVHVLTGIGLALMLTPAGAVIASNALPQAWKFTADLALPVIAVAIGAFWHPALTRWIPALFNRTTGTGK